MTHDILGLPPRTAGALGAAFLALVGAILILLPENWTRSVRSSRLLIAAVGFAVCGALCLLGLTGCASAPEWSRVQALRAQGDFVSKVSSSVSMYGHKKGDRLHVQIAAFNQIQPGDPVLFWDYTHDRPTFHLAKFKTTEGWVTQGTANKYPDAQLLTERTYVGRWEAMP